MRDLAVKWIRKMKDKKEEKDIKKMTADLIKAKPSKRIRNGVHGKIVCRDISIR
jgi:hypothetical protein